MIAIADARERQSEEERRDDGRDTGAEASGRQRAHKQSIS
jgi:hypothetical protein